MASILQSDTNDNNSQNIIKEQLTTFEEDRSMVTTTYPKKISPQVNTETIHETRDHTIIDVLNRPHQIGSITWDSQNNQPVPFTFTQPEYTAGNIRGRIAEYQFPKTLYTSNIVSKLANFLYLKADIEVSVRVNANPFQQGRLWLTFSPYASNDEVGKARNTLNEHKRAVSNFPGVEIDVGSGNEGTIVIPYCSPLKAYPLVNNNDGDMGYVRLYILNQLADGTDAPKAEITVYARFINVSVEIPTVSNPSSLMTQQNKLDYYKNLLKLDDDEIMEFFDMLPQTRGMLIAQGMGDTGEIEGTSKGIVTNLSGAVASLADTAAGMPVISEFAKPVSWVAKFVNAVASYFGWSKPTSIENTNGYYNYPAKNFTHCEGVDNGVVLSTIPDNHLDNTCKLFATVCDEMDFDYVLSRPTLERTFEWSTAAKQGTVLDKLPMQFEHHNETVIVGNQIAQADFSGVQRYVMNGFSLWRGDICIKISCIKTAYHSGRVQFIFTPFTDAEPSLSLRGDCYSAVMDLRESNEICMKIPYTSYTNYLACDSVNTNEIRNQTPLGFGFVQVIVINPLITNDNCSQTVDFNVWYSFAPGAELSCPTNRRFVPFDMELSTGLVAQGAGDTDISFSNMQRSEYVPIMNVNSSNMEDSTHCIGERIRSLRMLTRRFTATYRNAPTNNKLTRIRYGFKPPYLRGQAADEVDKRTFDNVEYFSWIYRFVRGSERYKFVDISNATKSQGAYISGPFSTYSTVTDQETWIQGQVIDEKGSLSGDLTITTLACVPSTVLRTDINNILEITIPSYSNVNKQVVGGALQAENTASYPFLSWYTTASSDNNVIVLRAMGDDASFGWLIGPPVTVDVSSFQNRSSTVSWDLSAITSIQQNLVGNPTDGYVAIAPKLNVQVTTGTVLGYAGFDTSYSGEDGRSQLLDAYISVGDESNYKAYFQELDLPTGNYSATTTLTNIKELATQTVSITPAPENRVIIDTFSTFGANPGNNPDFPSSFYKYFCSALVTGGPEVVDGNYSGVCLDKQVVTTAYTVADGFTAFTDIGIVKGGTSEGIFLRELTTTFGDLDPTETLANIKTVTLLTADVQKLE